MSSRHNYGHMAYRRGVNDRMWGKHTNPFYGKSQTNQNQHNMWDQGYAKADKYLYVVDQFLMRPAV